MDRYIHTAAGALELQNALVPGAVVRRKNKGDAFWGISKGVLQEIGPDHCCPFGRFVEMRTTVCVLPYGCKNKCFHLHTSYLEVVQDG